MPSQATLGFCPQEATEGPVPLPRAYRTVTRDTVLSKPAPRSRPKKKPRLSGAFPVFSGGAAQTLFCADMRPMKLSNVFSATRNHSACSVRYCFQESNTFLNLAFFAEISA